MTFTIKKYLVLSEGKWGLVDRVFQMAKDKGFTNLPKFSETDEKLVIDFS